MKGLIATIALLALVSAPISRPRTPRGVAATETYSAVDSLDDGPHVYWRSDSVAVVIYLCDEQVLTRVFEVEDTLRFRGLCADSLTEYVIPAAPPAVEPHIIDVVPEIIALSDIHGEYEATVDLLQHAGVIDESLRWRWGTGHLVIAGDVTDRGDRVTECMWLIHRLEAEARRAGGRVHYILGNHEIMVMQGDNRYANPKYLNGIARRTRIRHEDLYGPDMELGRWLRSKHVAVKLNGILFVHGGIGPHIVERGMSLADINGGIRERLDLPSYQIALDSLPAFLFGSLGPLWYRGYHYPMEDRYPRATLEEVETILAHYGVRAIVVGHTERDRVESLYAGRVFALDVPLQDLGSLQALLWKDGTFYRVVGDGERQPLTGTR